MYHRPADPSTCAAARKERCDTATNHSSEIADRRLPVQSFALCATAARPEETRRTILFCRHGAVVTHSRSSTFTSQAHRVSSHRDPTLATQHYRRAFS
jgi:hypothetical protein